MVIDDALQGVNRIVRGADLLSSTLQQRYLQKVLGFEAVSYGHLPLIMNELGQKLSKRAHAPPLDNQRSGQNLWDALSLLQQDPPRELRAGAHTDILQWAIEHWRPGKLSGIQEVPEASLFGDQPK